MSAVAARFTVVGVDLCVTFEDGTPPCGHVTLLHLLRPDTCQGPDVAIPFVGWLGLLRVLSDLLAMPADP